MPALPIRRRTHLAQLGASLGTAWGAGLAALAGSPARAQPEAGADAALAAALAGPQRSANNRARDAARHPAETLQFFGVRPAHSVLELSPGGGWYTEILAPWLRERGRLAVAHFARDDAQDYRRRGRANFEAKLAKHPELYDRVLVGTLPGGPLGPRFGELPLAPGSVDCVLTFRNVHNWLEDSQLDDILRASFALLRPGGVLGVVDHRAAPDTPLAQQIKTGYLTEALVAERLRAAGFVAEARSEVNANPRDTRDHPHGVWSLPPTLRGGEATRERFLAIGESDRFTHRYRKPG
ncbi:class I SAM-dependent methyltransferase [Aquabacterium sp. OR-4]|uniref:class I SAM-dependent methyltransferase n=1 Tax=Aquabacterium sp. OR-4 TaxID=2978127 RepID=UPI0021B43DFE|nr:methyltransferase [Aquabacterium sp. OR-4]MDT7838643.1 methyltransferase [Aquabacterium sp. OR-4]